MPPSAPEILSSSGMVEVRRAEGSFLVRDLELPVDGTAIAGIRVPAAPWPLVASREHLARLHPRAAHDAWHAGEVAFLDTETTGLSGGTGTIAFLVAVGWLETDAAGTPQVFRLRQFLMSDFADEPAMIASLVETLSRFRSFCTYNGACFDVPLLRTRGIMNRHRPAFWNRPNLDLLPFSRRLWRGTLANVRLATVESEILGVARSNDIPSALIPQAWLDFARSRRAGLIPRVLDHNAQDIASLASLLAVHLRCTEAADNPRVLRQPGECLGMARWYESQGNCACAARLTERALELMRGRNEREDEAMMRLARLRRRLGDWPGALEVWESLERRPLRVALDAWIEHAKYLEHQARDAVAARDLVRRCLVGIEMEEELMATLGRPSPFGDHVVEGLRRRLDRLQIRVRRAQSRAQHPVATMESAT